MSDRVQFLRSFLGALGAHRIVVSVEEDHQVSGTVTYDPSHSAQRQDFEWQAAEADVPGQSIGDLAELLRDQQLVHIDKIAIPRDELLQRYNEQYGTNLDPQRFSVIIERLKAVRVSMVDNGEESDTFFIHE